MYNNRLYYYIASLWPTDRFPAYTRTRGEFLILIARREKSDMKKEKGKVSEDLRLIII